MAYNESQLPERWMCIKSHKHFVKGQMYTLIQCGWEGKYTLTSLPFNKWNEQIVDTSKFDYVYASISEVTV